MDGAVGTADLLSSVEEAIRGSDDRSRMAASGEVTGSSRRRSGWELIGGGPLKLNRLHVKHFHRRLAKACESGAIAMFIAESIMRWLAVSRRSVKRAKLLQLGGHDMFSNTVAPKDMRKRQTNDAVLASMAMLRQKEAVKTNPRVLGALHDWWGRMPKNRQGLVDFETYEWLYTELYRVFAPDEEETVHEFLHDDWLDDCEGERGLHAHTFSNSVLRFIDIWDTTTTVTSYLSIIAQCVNTLFHKQPLPLPPRTPTPPTPPPQEPPEPHRDTTEAPHTTDLVRRSSNRSVTSMRGSRKNSLVGFKEFNDVTITSPHVNDKVAYLSCAKELETDEPPGDQAAKIAEMQMRRKQRQQSLGKVLRLSKLGMRFKVHRDKDSSGSSAESVNTPRKRIPQGISDLLNKQVQQSGGDEQGLLKELKTQATRASRMIEEKGKRDRRKKVRLRSPDEAPEEPLEQTEEKMEEGEVEEEAMSDEEDDKGSDGRADTVHQRRRGREGKKKKRRGDGEMSDHQRELHKLQQEMGQLRMRFHEEDLITLRVAKVVAIACCVALTHRSLPTPPQSILRKESLRRVRSNARRGLQRVATEPAIASPRTGNSHQWPLVQGQLPRGLVHPTALLDSDSSTTETTSSPADSGEGEDDGGAAKERRAKGRKNKAVRKAQKRHRKGAVGRSTSSFKHRNEFQRLAPVPIPPLPDAGMWSGMRILTPQCRQCAAVCTVGALIAAVVGMECPPLPSDVTPPNSQPPSSPPTSRKPSKVAVTSLSDEDTGKKKYTAMRQYLAEEEAKGLSLSDFLKRGGFPGGVEEGMEVEVWHNRKVWRAKVERVRGGPTGRSAVVILSDGTQLEVPVDRLRPLRKGPRVSFRSVADAARRMVRDVRLMRKPIQLAAVNPAESFTPGSVPVQSPPWAGLMPIRRRRRHTQTSSGVPPHSELEGGGSPQSDSATSATEMSHDVPGSPRGGAPSLSAVQEVERVLRQPANLVVPSVTVPIPAVLEPRKVVPVPPSPSPFLSDIAGTSGEADSTADDTALHSDSSGGDDTVSYDNPMPLPTQAQLNRLLNVMAGVRRVHPKPLVHVAPDEAPEASLKHRKSSELMRTPTDMSIAIDSAATDAAEQRSEGNEKGLTSLLTFLDSLVPPDDEHEGNDSDSIATVTASQQRLHFAQSRASSRRSMPSPSLSPLKRQQWKERRKRSEEHDGDTVVEAVHISEEMYPPGLVVTNYDDDGHRGDADTDSVVSEATPLDPYDSFYEALHRMQGGWEGVKRQSDGEEGEEGVMGEVERQTSLGSGGSVEKKKENNNRGVVQRRAGGEAQRKVNEGRVVTPEEAARGEEEPEVQEEKYHRHYGDPLTSSSAYSEGTYPATDSSSYEDDIFFPTIPPRTPFREDTPLPEPVILQRGLLADLADEIALYSPQATPAPASPRLTRHPTHQHAVHLPHAPAMRGKALVGTQRSRHRRKHTRHVDTRPGEAFAKYEAYMSSLPPPIAVPHLKPAHRRKPRKARRPDSARSGELTGWGPDSAPPTAGMGPVAGSLPPSPPASPPGLPSIVTPKGYRGPQTAPSLLPNSLASLAACGRPYSRERGVALEDWSSRQVVSYLLQHGVSRTLCRAFRRHGVTGKALAAGDLRPFVFLLQLPLTAKQIHRLIATIKGLLLKVRERQPLTPPPSRGLHRPLSTQPDPRLLPRHGPTHHVVSRPSAATLPALRTATPNPLQQGHLQPLLPLSRRQSNLTSILAGSGPLPNLWPTRRASPPRGKLCLGSPRPVERRKAVPDLPPAIVGVGGICRPP